MVICSLGKMSTSLLLKIIKQKLKELESENKELQTQLAEAETERVSMRYDYYNMAFFYICPSIDESMNMNNYYKYYTR